MTLQGKTLLITGASRGIGKAIALRAALDGARIAIAAKTAEPHPTLPGTIFTAAAEIEAAGGQALPLAVDVRDEAQVERAVAATVARFGGVDILVNNASAISLTSTEATPMKRVDLMHQVNARASFLCAQKVLPHLRRASNPHVLNIAPPLHSTLTPRWFGAHLAYTMAKYGMSLCVLGMAEEWKAEGIAVNALWPRTAIDTAAIGFIMGPDARRRCRLPTIMADAAHWVLTQPSRDLTGQFLIDDEVVRRSGVTDLAKYRHPGVREEELLPDFFV